MSDVLAVNQRVYGVLRWGDAGKFDLDLSLMRPNADPKIIAAFILRGMILEDHPIALAIVSDPTQDPALRGPAGANATSDQVAAAANAWLAAHAAQLVGVPGNPGAAGTITISKVTTLPAGQPATIVNKGTTNAALLEISIPAGAKGDKGDTGPTRRVVILEQTSLSTGLVTFAFSPAFDAPPDVTPRIKAPTGLIAATCEIVSVTASQAVIRCARVVAGVPVLSAGVTVSLRAEALA